MLHCDILSKGFQFFFLFDFVYAINIKIKPCFSMPNGMLVVNAIFPTMGGSRIKTCAMKQNICTKYW